MSMGDFVYAVDLGGTNLRMAAVSAGGNVLSRVKMSTPGNEGSAAIVDAIVNAAGELSDSLSGHPRAISLAVPAIVNHADGMIVQAPNLPSLDQFDLAYAVQSNTGIPVCIENDANAAAIGESWLGSSKGSKHSIMITLGTGVGGGIIIDGKIVRGADGTAGEVGHINVEHEGVQCGCGSHGCLEQYTSAKAIVRLAAEANLPGFGNGVETESESSDVFKMAQSGNQDAIDIFKKQGFYLGLAIAGLLNCLNPEVVVIGGGAAAAWDFFVPSLREELSIRAYAEAVARVNIVRAGLADDSGVLGSARLGFEIDGTGIDKAL